MPARVASLTASLLLATSLACKPAATAPPAAAPTPTSASTATITKSRITWTHACTPDAKTSGCTEAHPPVCGQKSDLTRVTFTDSCAACSDPEVLYYMPGTCRDEPPA